MVIQAELVSVNVLNKALRFGHLMSDWRVALHNVSIIIGVHLLGGFMRVLLNSSSIAEVTWHSNHQVLEVFFLSGHVYRYGNISENVFQALIQASSAGRYYNRYIKGKYPSLRWF